MLGYTVEFGTCDDFFFLFSEIFVRQTYDFASQSTTPYVLDCGSNIGMSVLFFKLTHPGATVVAFEPGKQAFDCLTKNIAANRLDQVVAHNKALSSAEGTVDFHYDDANPTSVLMGTRRAGAGTDSCRVAATRLSEHVDREVDFLKLDIEGAELETMSELAASGKLPLIKQMAIEYHHHLDAGADHFAALLSVLETGGFGYQIESPHSLGRPFRREHEQDVLVYAYRKDPSD